MFVRFFKLLLFTTFFAIFCLPVQAQSYQMHAVYMYSFTRYIDWPAGDSGDFVIGVLGESPIMPHLAKMAAQKKVNNREIRLIKYASPDEFTGESAMVFISDEYSEDTQLINDILAKAGKSHCLIITDRVETRTNSHVNFIMEGEKLLFELNKAEIEKSGLRVSSELLALARVVDENQTN